MDYNEKKTKLISKDVPNNVNVNAEGAVKTPGGWCLTMSVIHHLFDNSVDFFIDKRCLCNEIPSSLVRSKRTTMRVKSKCHQTHLIVSMVVIHLCFQSNFSFD